MEKIRNVQYTTEMDTMVNVRIDGEKLRRLRQRNLWTQQALSEASGVNRDSISRLESGKSGAHVATVKKLGRALGVDPRELIADE